MTPGERGGRGLASPAPGGLRAVTLRIEKRRPAAQGTTPTAVQLSLTLVTSLLP